MSKKEIIFELLHLERYAIIEKPCTIIVKNKSELDFFNIYDPDGNPRWLLNLKAITQENLDTLKELADSVELLFYSDISHLLMSGALWEEQVEFPMDLPAKGEDMIAVFDYVDDVLRCTSITLIPRRKPKLYYASTEYLAQIEAFAQLVDDVDNYNFKDEIEDEI